MLWWRRDTRIRPTSIDTTPEIRLFYSHGISMLYLWRSHRFLCLGAILLRNDKLGIWQAHFESKLWQVLELKCRLKLHLIREGFSSHFDIARRLLIPSNSSCLYHLTALCQTATLSSPSMPDSVQCIWMYLRTLWIKSPRPDRCLILNSTIYEALYKWHRSQ